MESQTQTATCQRGIGNTAQKIVKEQFSATTFVLKDFFPSIIIERKTFSPDLTARKQNPVGSLVLSMIPSQFDASTIPTLTIWNSGI